MPDFSTDWFTSNIPLWEKHLGAYKGRPGIRFLEIGSFEGRSACWLLENILTHPSSHLTCIDTFAGNEGYAPMHAGLLDDLEERFNANIRSIGATARVTTLKGESERMLRTLPLGSFDCAYVDGSHDAPDVLTDAVLSWLLLRDGAILIFDDYEWRYFDDPLRAPKTGIDAFLHVFDGHYELLEQGWQVIVRKRSGAGAP